MTQDELRSLKRALYRWAKENLRGLSVINEASGNKIEISARGIDEWFSKSKSEEQIKSIAFLPELLKDAKYTHSEKNIHSERKNAPAFEYYECPLMLEKKNLTR